MIIRLTKEQAERIKSFVDCLFADETIVEPLTIDSFYELTKQLAANAGRDIEAIEPKPLNIHEGTTNHVRMILKACDEGNATEAGYLACDLLDQFINRALVVTMRVPPLDHTERQQFGLQEYQRGYEEASAATSRRAHAAARKELKAKLDVALRAVLDETVSY